MMSLLGRCVDDVKPMLLGRKPKPYNVFLSPFLFLFIFYFVFIYNLYMLDLVSLF